MTKLADHHVMLSDARTSAELARWNEVVASLTLIGIIDFQLLNIIILQQMLVQLADKGRSEFISLGD